VTPNATTCVRKITADRARALVNPGSTGLLLRKVRFRKHHLRLYRVTENRQLERRRPNRRTKGINGKIAKRTQSTAIVKERVGVTKTMTMQIHGKDGLVG
jgi:hypothetical protein